jgi:hypothetical protein
MLDKFSVTGMKKRRTLQTRQSRIFQENQKAKKQSTTALNQDIKNKEDKKGLSDEIYTALLQIGKKYNL